jgi:membrane-bound lytic murein transglycosylase D
MEGKSKPLFQTIERVLVQYDLPLQLKYLAVVESALLSRARSAAGARGLWQLMPSTAKELGLNVSGKTDERLHTYRSTVAAAKYLRGLYAEFGDWLLVLAAYNGGPGTVHRAIKKAGSKNFWALQRYLPAESRGHVKRFISIHYFFEGEGSITTQTRAEALAWEEKLCAEQGMLAAMIQ